jgi:hypothetical protein
MEPCLEEPHRKQPGALAPRLEEKPNRFRILKLEERLAPRGHGSGGGLGDGGSTGSYGSIE